MRGWGWASKPHCPSARAAVGAASAANLAHPWMASAWPANPAGTGPSARTPVSLASTAKAASSCVPAAGTGTSVTLRLGSAHAVSPAGWDPGIPRMRPPVLRWGHCSGVQWLTPLCLGSCNISCPAGTFGDGCQLLCPECIVGSCDPVSGDCICQAGYWGPR